MKVQQSRRFMIARLVLVFVFLAGTGTPARASTIDRTVPKALSPAVMNRLDLISNIETAGIVVSGVDLPRTAQLLYQRSGESNWRTGHPLVKIDDGRLVGSLFGLSA